MRRLHLHTLALFAALPLAFGCSGRERLGERLCAGQHALLARVYSAAEAPGPAANECLLGLRTQPDNPSLRTMLASSALKIGLERWALESIAGCPFDPRQRGLWHDLAWYAYDKQHPAFVTLSRQILLYDPFDADTANGLAYYYAERNENLSEAEGLARRALALAPEDGAILDTVGWVCYRQGRYQEALRYLQRAVAQPGMARIPEVAEHLAAVYEALGDEQTARRLRAQASLGQRPPSEPAGVE